MLKHFTLLAACLVFLASQVEAQNFYYAPEGKTFLTVSPAKILVKFKEGTSLETQKQILEGEAGVAPISSENQLPAPKVTLVDLFNVNNEASVYELLTKLRAHETVEFANHFLAHEDGTLHGITEKLLVGLQSAADLANLEEAAVRWGLTVVGPNEFDPLMIHLEVSKESAGNALEMANRLFESGRFAYAEPDFLRLMTRYNTNDPFVNNQWSLNNDGVNTSQWNGVPGSDMNVFNAWNTTSGSSSVKTAIIDEGVDLTHNDLTPNLLPGYDATGQGSNGAPSGNDAHGTACAGIVAAVGNNNTGIAGVAYGSKIIPVRIAYSNSNGNWVTSNSWIGNAINWAWQTGGADILSNSWGGGGSSSTINNAISGAVNNGRGGLGSPVLFAAGNSNGNNSYPATYSPTISVIAMSMCNQRKSPSSCDGESWWGSNYSNGADVAAPGVKIYTTDISGSAGYSSGDYTSSFNGTSSACPNAAGVMALIFSANSSLTETQARAIMESTCDKTGGYTYNNNVNGQPNGSWSNDLGYGRLNAHAAVLAAAPAGPDDAGVSAILTPVGTVCASSVTPEIELTNYGNNTLNSVTINYQLDGGTVSTINWSGSLASTASTTVLLSSISLTGGNHTFKAFTTNPNGVSDTNTNNDDTESTFNSGTNGLTLTIVLDNYPEETSWDVEDSNGNIVAAGGTYGNEPDGSTLTLPFCVADGCFDFTIYDSYGDGICCGYGNGSYSLVEDASGTVLASGGNFNNSETTNFCVPAGPPPLVVTIAETDVSCAGGSDGAAVATATGGTPSYNYNWSNGASGSTINGLTAGTYTVTVTDNDGTTATESVTINSPSPVTVSVAGSNPSGGNNNGTASASASGGTPSYQYAWSNGASGEFIDGLSAGTYTVTATDANGCTGTNSITLVNGASPLTVTITHNDVSCNGGNDGSATAAGNGGTPGYSYAWSNGASGASINGLTAGTYTVTVTDNASQTASSSVTIGQPSALTVTATSTDDTGASDGTATASGSGGIPSYAYNWSNGGSGATITGLAAGTYTVTVTDQNSCTASTSVVVNSSASNCTFSLIDFTNFESGWGIWNDGGSDCRRNANDAPYAIGTYCVRLRDNTNSSVMTTNVLDLSGYDEVFVGFSYYTRSFDNSNEDFWLQISTDGGSTYTTVEEWNLNDEFVNGQRYQDTVYITGPFTSNSLLRFRCDASANSDWVYLDRIQINGCVPTFNREEWVGETTPVADSEVIKNTKDQAVVVPRLEVKPLAAIQGLRLFPNPVQEKLTLAFDMERQADVQLLVTDLNGKSMLLKQAAMTKGTQQWTVDAGRLNPGIYFAHLMIGAERVTRRFVVIR